MKETIKNSFAILFAGFTLISGASVLFQLYSIVTYKINLEEIALLVGLLVIFVVCVIFARKSKRIQAGLEALFSW